MMDEQDTDSSERFAAGAAGSEPPVTRRTVGGHEVRGLAVDADTRCAHYDDDHDVIAIAFPCCEPFYPCFRCHDAVADHDRERWPADRFDETAVLCGACSELLAIEAYLDADACPQCGHAFNPGCADHYGLYFED